MDGVLVTGGAGFIGSHLVDLLVETGRRVVVVDDLSSGKREHVNPRAKLYRLDLADPALEGVFQAERIGAVAHHAAQIDVRKSVADPLQDARVNVQGLLNLVQSCRQHKVGGLVFASSGGVVYGQPERLPVDETAPKGPLSPYGVSKLAGEYYLYYYHRTCGLPSIALRYANVYGPRQDPLGEAGVVAIFAGLMLEGKTPTIFGDGGQARDFVYVEDVARANLLALERLEGLGQPRSLDEHAYNVGTGRDTSVAELFDRLAGLTGFGGEKAYGPERAGELRRICLDPAKAERELGWAPSVSLEAGLRRTVEFFRRAG